MFHVKQSEAEREAHLRSLTKAEVVVKIGLSYDQGSPKYRLYAGALMAAGEQHAIDVQPLWLAGRERSVDEAAIATMDGLVLTGGGDVEPHRYGFTDGAGVCDIQEGRDAIEWEILRVALERRIPILAICRGMQLLNVFQGGTLIPHLPTTADHRLDDAERHIVEIEPGSGLAMLTGTTSASATSSHHQAVDRLGNGLTVCARHPDGTIEAIEWTHPMRKPWLAAVQWHPERMGLEEPLSGSLYRGFLQAVAVSHV